MKIIYALFRSEITTQLHKYLTKKIKLNPVYVLGDRGNISQKAFHKTIFHSIKDSRNGIPPKNYNHKYQSFVDDKFYKFMSKYSEMAISMMGRQSEDEWSFSYSERKNFFYYLCNYWYGVILNFQPDCILFRVVPHFASEYILFQVCKFHNVTPITVISTPFNYSYLTNDLDKQKILLKNLNNYPSNFVENYINSNLTTYQKAIPKYMIENLQHQKEAEKLTFLIFSLVKDFLRIIFYKNKYTTETIKKPKIPVFFKRSQQTFTSLMLHKLKVRYNIYKNKKIYENLCSDLNDLPDNFILFSPNYQPERSTMPDAGEFHDVLQNLDILSSTVPSSFKIIYKEHPMIFNYPGKVFFRGHLFRGKEYYLRAKSYENVIFVNQNADIFRLIDQSKAVVSPTGTIIFQSSIRGKPVISFGNNWLSTCSCVYNYINREDLQLFFKKVESNSINNSKNIEKWTKHIDTICKYGFKSPNLLDSQEKFYTKNYQFINSVVETLKAIKFKQINIKN